MKKLSFSHVKEEIDKEGYTLLSNEYKNNHSKISLQCPNNHIFGMGWNNFKQGQRCPVCMRKVSSDKIKLSYNIVKEQIEKEGYYLVSTEYISANKKLTLLCPENHEFDIRFSNFHNGTRCPECCIDKQRLSYDFIKQEIDKEGYTLLSNEYKNAFVKLEIECPHNHIFDIRWNDFQQGKRCPQCFMDKQRLPYNHVKEQIEKEEYVLLSTDYKNSYSKISLKCPEGHTFKMKWNSFQRGQRCPQCWKEGGASNKEKELLNFIRKIYNGCIQPNDRSQIINPLTGRYLEIDIWLPEIRFAIEFNGTFWHKTKYSQKKDAIKVSQCSDKQIQLMVINECDWDFDKQTILNDVKSNIQTLVEV